MDETQAVIARLNTLGDYLNWANELFTESDIYFGHGTDNPWDEAVMIALYVLQLPAENDASLVNRVLTSQEKADLVQLAIRRVEERMPVPYLTGEAWFAGERYKVTPEVLIPRSPIAETILNNFQPWLGKKQPRRILDLCTGSGCLAILTAKQFPDAKVDAADISSAALEIAKQNTILHLCENRVQAIQSDLFAGLTGKYDIIISNPPYVSEQEMKDLPQEYKHEPDLALVSGVQGLDITFRILREANKFLNDDGLLFVEVGNSWDTLANVYPEIPFTWLEFSNGGNGVFMLTAEQLKDLQK